MASESEEKTEQPTAHKLREARKRGEVGVSRDLTGAIELVAAFFLLWLGGGFMELQMRRVLDAALDVVGSGGSSSAVGPAIEQMLIAMLWIVVPLLLLVTLIAVVVGLLQTQGVLSADPLKIRFERLNPAESLKLLFSTRQLGVLIQMVLKVCLLGGVIAWTLWTFMRPLIMEIYGETANTGLAGLTALQVMFGACALVLAVLGTIDFVHQRFEYIKMNRMSKTERKREHKDTDGDPHIKGEQRRLQRELRDSPVKPGLAGANVVVTNPTHFAVALYYEPGVVELPVVVAKGQDDEALRMRREAGQRAIPVLESPPLARSLFRSVALGEYIGDEHVEAVAEVFRWLSSLKGQAVDARDPPAARH
ncbi:MAG: EscU/YscU/HrcU family type III secretion system export apparatus switch protein [Methylibium sp.]|uniref:EscU/YscU/HrcU family type III secretion system export apparatus switch protein n=1 Tax=Methylibium sp. TaxID=2067992 RepID=UPI00180A7208|nr:EscU/YscU/HrcU family type III secretion system export apparatus switch protein [Methylibium sp.]MBA3596395.1 EscU/YscU/HrcU family type III secretion system export apparatus switch protein [Methylibium sp.]